MKPLNMKKILLAFSTILFLSQSSDAQVFTSIGDKFTFGHSWTIGNRQDNQKYKFHPMVQVGRMGKLNFSENVSLGLGTFFSTEGVTFEDETANTTYEQRMNYIRIPLIATFDLGNSVNKVLPRLSIGPSVGFLVGGKSLIKNEDDVLLGLKTRKLISTDVDAGINASLGVNVKITEGFTFSPDITYYHGLVENKYNSGVASGLGDLPTFTHRNLGISMGMTINSDAMKAWKAKMHKR